MRKRRTFVRRFLRCIFHQHILVQIVGLEPTHLLQYKNLNLARLPVPPYLHIKWCGWWDLNPHGITTNRF